MSVRRYNDIQINRIRFDKKPYKKIKTIKVEGSDFTKSIYYIDAYYIDQPLYIQIPKCKVRALCKDDMTVILSVNLQFNTFIKDLETFVVNCVYNNSERWFDKTFTMNKITKCMVSISEVSGEDVELSLSLSKHIKLYDQYKKQISIEELKCGLEVVPILHFANLQFIDNMFICNMVVEQAKVYNDSGLVEYSIIESDNCSTISSTSSMCLEKISVKTSNSNSSRIVCENKDKPESETKSDTTILKDEYYDE
jgi:hypothetical protein